MTCIYPRTMCRMATGAMTGPLRPNDQTAYDDATTAARTARGETAFTAAWATGRAMTLEQAIVYAMEW